MSAPQRRVDYTPMQRHAQTLKALERIADSLDRLVDAMTPSEEDDDE